MTVQSRFEVTSNETAEARNEQTFFQAPAPFTVTSSIANGVGNFRKIGEKSLNDQLSEAFVVVVWLPICANFAAISTAQTVTGQFSYL
jgi:hypothetical protein